LLTIVSSSTQNGEQRQAQALEAAPVDDERKPNRRTSRSKAGLPRSKGFSDLLLAVGV